MTPAGPTPASFEQYGFAPVTEMQLATLQQQIESEQTMRKQTDVDALEMELDDLVSQLDTATGAQRQAVLNRATTVMRRLEAYDNGDDPGRVIEDTRTQMRGLATQVVTV